MSNIFDALLKSEAERAGGNGTLPPSVNDVLSKAERRAVGKRDADPDERGSGGLQKNREAAAIAAVTGHKGHSDHQGPLSAVLAEHLGAAVIPIADEEPRIALTECRTIQLEMESDWKLVSCTDKSSAAAEAFRLLAVRLRHIQKEKQLKKLLITSTVPQEGKSLTSANLACTLSAGGSRKVLLLEGDVHRPSITHALHLASEPGLCELLQGHSTIEESTYRLEGPEFWVLPAGQGPGHPLDLIQSPKVPELLEQLNEVFDWIIIDSPPVLPMADTSILARLAEGILLVTRRGISEKKVLERGLQALDKSKLLGAVVNSSRRHGHSYYYYYGGGQTARSRKLIRPDPS